MSQMTYDQIKAELVLFTNATFDKYGSHSFAAGYFESTIATLLQEMPKRKRDALIVSFRKSAGEMVK